MSDIGSIRDLRPGDIGFQLSMSGAAGVLVYIGQGMLGEDGPRHTFIVTRVVGNIVMAVEAMPGGAREVNIADRWTSDYVYLRLPDETCGPVVGLRAGLAAIGLVGTPYSFIDYLALALRHWGFRAEWLRARITSYGHMICSQLVDQSLTHAGVHVFSDERLPQDVTPGALFRRLSQLGASSSWPE